MFGFFILPPAALMSRLLAGKRGETMGTIIMIIIGLILITLFGLWLVGERGKLLLPSTGKFIKEAGLKRQLDLQGLHGYVYGRWTKQYVRFLIYEVVPRLKGRGKKWLADRYHAKVLTEDQARSIITLNRSIPLRDLEQIIPYPRARDLVLNGPPDVAVYECPCRHARPTHCEPTQVCMTMGQPFVDFVLQHHPRSSRQLTQPQALWATLAFVPVPFFGQRLSIKYSIAPAADSP